MGDADTNGGTNIVERLIEAAGDIYVLADRIGVSYQAIQRWVRNGRVPPGRVLAAERAVRRQYTRTQIRPDLYPPRRASKPRPPAMPA